LGQKQHQKLTASNAALVQRHEKLAEAEEEWLMLEEKAGS